MERVSVLLNMFLQFLSRYLALTFLLVLTVFFYLILNIGPNIFFYKDRSYQQQLRPNIKSLKQYLYILVEQAKGGSLDNPVNMAAAKTVSTNFWRYEHHSITSMLMYFLLENFLLCRNQIREILVHQSSSPLQMVDKV